MIQMVRASAAETWRAQLAGWEIPPAIATQAPEPPWGFPVGLFRAEPEPTETPSRDVALDALPGGGSVLDVGCGGGAGGLALVPPAGSVTGVDDGAGVLAGVAPGAPAPGGAHP